jgi:hypothetical protein
MLATATAMVGLAVTQARADRLKLYGGCPSVPCNAETLTVSGGSFSFGASIITGDIANANITALEFAPQIIAGSDLGFPSARVLTTAKVSGPQVSAINHGNRPVSDAVALLSNTMLWSFNGPAMASSWTRSLAPLALPEGHGRVESFSVVATNSGNNFKGVSGLVQAESSYRPRGVHLDDPKLIGAPAVPEPTTMLLFGTGLVGAAAVLRKRRRGRRAGSK